MSIIDNRIVAHKRNAIRYKFGSEKQHHTKTAVTAFEDVNELQFIKYNGI
jgi:hypothetical protein